MFLLMSTSVSVSLPQKDGSVEKLADVTQPMATSQLELDLYTYPHNETIVLQVLFSLYIAQYVSCKILQHHVKLENCFYFFGDIRTWVSTLNWTNFKQGTTFAFLCSTKI